MKHSAMARVVTLYAALLASFTRVLKQVAKRTAKSKAKNVHETGRDVQWERKRTQKNTSQISEICPNGNIAKRKKAVSCNVR